MYQRQRMKTSSTQRKVVMGTVMAKWKRLVKCAEKLTFLLLQNILKNQLINLLTSSINAHPFIDGMIVYILKTWMNTTHWVVITRMPLTQSITSFDFDFLADNNLRPLVYTENVMNRRRFDSTKKFFSKKTPFSLVRLIT